MRLLARRDAPLAAALICAALVVFQESIGALLNFARQVESSYRLELVPGLVILLVMFGFHQYAKYQETKRFAAAADTEARQLRERTHELEQLSRCGQVLGRALSFDALRVAVWRHLPELLPDADTWLALLQDGRWEMLADTRPEPEKWWEDHMDGIARAVEDHGRAGPPFRWEGHWCYPLVAHDNVVGVLGIAGQGAEPADRVHRLIEALGSLLAIAVHNVQLFAQVKRESTRDPLTGCLRRAPAMELLAAELRRARRTHAPVSVIMFDVDGFKQVNDQHGHQCGDRLLAEVGRLVTRQLRSSDVKCRYGGDEFLLILPETAAAGGLHVAEALRTAVADLAIPWRGQTVRVSASVGLATNDETDDVEQIVERADAALYAAKNAGRDCVRAADGESPSHAEPPAVERPGVEAAAVGSNLRCA